MQQQTNTLQVPIPHSFSSAVDPMTLSPNSRKVLIWKERNKSSQFLDVLGDDNKEMVMDSIDNQPDLVYLKVLSAYHSYDLIPTSSKLVVFDTNISIKKAFLALIYTGVRAAPLWHAQKKCYIGMLTITDFIKLIRKYYNQSGVNIAKIENHRITTWREVLDEYKRPLVYIHPEATLLDAIHTLQSQNVHRLPVIDPLAGDVLFIVTHKRILRFLFIYIYDLPEPSFMKKSLKELKLGTYHDLFYATKKTPLIEVIDLLLDQNISALPIVDNEMKVVDLFAKFDVIYIAPDQAYTDLSKPVDYCLQLKKRKVACVETCTRDCSLKRVMEKIASAEVHRLVIVDEKKRLDGIISLSDILKFLISHNPYSSTAL